MSHQNHKPLNLRVKKPKTLHRAVAGHQAQGIGEVTDPAGRVHFIAARVEVHKMIETTVTPMQTTVTTKTMGILVSTMEIRGLTVAITQGTTIRATIRATTQGTIIRATTQDTAILEITQGTTVTETTQYTTVTEITLGITITTQDTTVTVEGVNKTIEMMLRQVHKSMRKCWKTLL